MALVGNISGSSNASSLIGVTGSIIFSNSPGSTFPSALPGTDVQFFVSGAVGGKDGATRAVALFGGDVVISGTLHGGSPLKVGTDIGVTGSLALKDVLSAPTAGASEAVLYSRAGTLYFKNAGGSETAVGSGGGGGSNFFTEGPTGSPTAGIIYSSGTVAFTGARTGETISSAAQKGTDVVFYFSGSTGASPEITLFGGDLTSSGSLRIKDNQGSGTKVILGNEGTISGSSTIQAGGSITTAGDIAVNGGNVTTTSTGTATLFNTNATALNIGQAASITMGADGTGTTTIRNSTVTLSKATALNLSTTSAAAITHVGASGQNLAITSTNGNVLIENVIFSTDDVTIPGNLTVNGTTTTVNTDNLVVRDQLIYMASRSLAGTVDYGGIAVASGANVTDQALVFVKDTNGTESIWSSGRQDVTAGTRTTNSGLVYLPIRASKFELGGTVAGSNSVFLTSSLGSDFMASATGGATVKSSTGKVILDAATNQGTEFQIGTTAYGVVKDGTIAGTPSVAGTIFGSTAGNTLIISGSKGVALQSTSAGFTLYNATDMIGSIVGSGGTPGSMTVTARDGSGVSRTMTVSGSSTTVGAHSGNINLAFVNTTRSTIGYASNKVTYGTSGTDSLEISGSNGVNIVHDSTNGIQLFGRGGLGATAYLTIEKASDNARFRGAGGGAPTDIIIQPNLKTKFANSGNTTVFTIQDSGGSSGNASLYGEDNKTVTLGAVGASGVMNVSGSTVGINVGSGGLKIYRDWSDALQINTNGSTLTTISGSSGQSVKLAAGTGSTTLALSGSAVELNASVLSGITFKKDGTAFAVAGQTTDGITGLFPSSDRGASLGSPSNRWDNVYTGDLHLRNERGNWTIIEEEEYLSITNNISGKRYKFVLEEI